MGVVSGVEQTFRPSLPHLVAVEVGLVVATPGQTDRTLTMTLLDQHGRSRAAVTQLVPVDHCDHALFTFPNGGVILSTRELYSIRLSGGTDICQPKKLALTIRRDRVRSLTSQLRLGSKADTKKISLPLKRLRATCFLRLEARHRSCPVG